MRIDDGAWRLTGGGRRGDQRPEAFGIRGMVASAHPVAAAVGSAVLQQGGNAFDAAIAMAGAEGVALPMMCGLGGDAFVVLYHAGSRSWVGFNGSGVAASGVSREYYVSRGHRLMPLEGVHSVGVPGAVSVYEAIWKRYGSWPWADLWAPAIRLAEDGIAITDHISRRIAERAPVLAHFPHSARMYLPGGGPPAPGDRFTSAELAKSLRVVASGGAEAFYRGELAERLVTFLQHEGLPVTADDFARQEAYVYTPITATYRGLTVHETAPVSQGFLLLTQLNILDGFDLTALSPTGADRMHLLVEAKKLAFADRNRYAGDRAFVDFPLERLLSPEHAAQRRRSLDRAKAGRPEAGALPERGGDTSYFAVADGDGNAVSFIHSLSASFGSGVVAGDTGIMLNNRVGRGFSLDEGHPNVLAPGKRTMHTLNAFLVARDGRPWLVGGTPGGDQQTQWSTQVLTGVIDHGQSLQDAVEAPRWYSSPGTDPHGLDQPMTIRAESRISGAALSDLVTRGHVVETLAPWAGGGAFQILALDESRGVLRGASDPRAGGVALGV